MNGAPASERSVGPRVPETFADVGLPAESVHDLLLKTLYVHGNRTGQQLMQAIGLPFSLLDDALLVLQQRRLVEIGSAGGVGRAGYRFDLTGVGRERAREALAACQYVGPAPVPLAQYRAWVEAQSIRSFRVSREQLAHRLRHLVLDADVIDRLGPAVNAARSLFLHGPSGNGKTAIAEAIARLFGGEIFVPYAVDIDGQIMVVHDPLYHRPVPGDEPYTGPGTEESVWASRIEDLDRRFARVLRPVVVTGGELTLDQLDLRYDPSTRVYQAPFQVKANGGVLVLDDFGRQRMPPGDLLNRWIVPLEKRTDFLTLHTGNKFPVPFDCLLILATNIAPEQLVEEAFLRRIHYKVRVRSPNRAQFEEIFRRCCLANGIAYAPSAVEHLYAEYYGRRGIAPRGCHPRDILDHLIDTARYLDVEPVLSVELLDHACRSYFLDATGSE